MPPIKGLACVFPLCANAIIFADSPSASTTTTTLGPIMRTPDEVAKCFRFSGRNHECPREKGWPPNAPPAQFRNRRFNNDDDFLRSRLANKRVLVLGDSVGKELHNALKCYFDNHNANISFDNIDMQVVPHHMNHLMTQLDEVTNNTDVVIVAFGAWYNFNFENWTMPTGISTEDVYQEAHSSRVEGHGDRHDYDPYEVDDHVPDSRSAHWPHFGYRYSLWRRRARLLGLSHYVSDLMRLQKAITDFTKTRKRKDLRWVWKSTPPQHWNTTTGQYDWKPDHPIFPCVPNRDKQGAYSRTQVAINVMGLKQPSSPFTFVDTFEEDIGLWAMHDNVTTVDCTHYCMHSQITWNWVRAVLEEVFLKE